jgi:hypothetical protein
MNSILLSASSEMAIVSDSLMPLLTQNIVVSLVIVALLVFFGRSVSSNMEYTEKGT